MTGNYLHNHPQFRSLLNIVAEEEDILPAVKFIFYGFIKSRRRKPIGKY